MHLICMIASQDLALFYVIAESRVHLRNSAFGAHADMPVAVVGQRKATSQAQYIQRFAEHDRFGLDFSRRLFRCGEYDFVFACLAARRILCRTL